MEEDRDTEHLSAVEIEDAIEDSGIRGNGCKNWMFVILLLVIMASAILVYLVLIGVIR